MRTISNSRHRTLARTSVSPTLTTPNTQNIPSKYRLRHFLNIYMWSRLPVLCTDGFNTFKRGIIHSFEASDLAWMWYIKCKWNSFLRLLISCANSRLWNTSCSRLKKSNPGNYIITESLFWKNIGKLVKSHNVRSKILDKLGPGYMQVSSS